MASKLNDNYNISNWSYNVGSSKYVGYSVQYLVLFTHAVIGKDVFHEETVGDRYYHHEGSHHQVETEGPVQDDMIISYHGGEPLNA